DASSMLEHFRGHELLENAPRVGVGKTRCRAHRLHARVKPMQLVVGPNVPALERDRTAIARLQPAQEFRQGDAESRAAELHRQGDRVIEQQAVAAWVKLSDA